MPEFHIVSLFPEYFDTPLAQSLLGRATNAGRLGFSLHNPRDFSDNRHRHVDDRPFGGGPGMVMQAEPIYRAIKSMPEPGRIVILSPSDRKSVV